MKGGKSTIWAVVALLVFWAVYWGTRPDHGPVAHGVLVSVEEPDGLEIEKRDGEVIHLSKTDGSWMVVVDDDGRKVPADETLVTDALSAVAGVEIKDTVSTNPEKYGVYGVADDQAGAVVTIRKGSDDLARIIVGNVDRTGMNTYVRLDGEERVVVLPGRLRSRFAREPVEWRLKNLVSLVPSAVRRVSVTYGDVSYVLARTDEPGWEIRTKDGENGGENIEKIRPSAPEAYLSALAGLRAGSFTAEPVPEGAEVFLEISWEGNESGSITLFADPNDSSRLLIADGPGGDTAVVQAANIGTLKKKPEDFPARENPETPKTGAEQNKVQGSGLKE